MNLKLNNIAWLINTDNNLYWRNLNKWNMNKTSNYLSIMSIKINNYYSFIENNDKINRLPSGTFFLLLNLEA